MSSSSTSRAGTGLPLPLTRVSDDTIQSYQQRLATEREFARDRSDLMKCRRRLEEFDHQFAAAAVAATSTATASAASEPTFSPSESTVESTLCASGRQNNSDHASSMLSSTSSRKLKARKFVELDDAEDNIMESDSANFRQHDEFATDDVSREVDSHSLTLKLPRLSSSTSISASSSSSPVQTEPEASIIRRVVVDGDDVNPDRASPAVVSNEIDMDNHMQVNHSSMSSYISVHF